MGLAVALFGSPFLGLLDLSDRLSSSATGTMLLNSVLMWLLVGVLLGIVVSWEQRPLASIGLELPSRRHAAIGVGGGVVGLVVGILATGAVVAAFNLDPPKPLATIGDLSLPVKLVIVGTAVVTEELLWRGYPIERLTELTGSLWVGAATSVVVFLAVHFPAWGIVGAIPQAIFTVALVGVYVTTRNVVASILTHTVINVVMLLVVPTFL